MPREENGPVRQHKEFGSGQPKLANVYRPSDKSLVRQQIKLIRSHLEEQEKMLDKFKDDIMRLFDQLAARLEQDARQPRFTMEADGPANTKTRERTESAATVVQAMRGDSFSARRVEPGPNTNSISFGVKAEPPDLLQERRFGRGRRCRTHVMSPILGDAHNNSHRWLSSHRQNLHSNGDHLQPATSSVLRDRGDESEGEKILTSIPSTWYDSSFWKLLPAPLRSEGYRDKTDAK